jgi:hypothetical protein
MPSERAKSALIAVPSSTENDVGEACPICFDSGMEIVPGKEHAFARVKDRRQPGRISTKQSFPSRYNQCHFNNYTTADPSQLKGLAISRFNSRMSIPRSIVDYSSPAPVGVGKTHLAGLDIERPVRTRLLVFVLRIRIAVERDPGLVQREYQDIRARRSLTCP